MNPNRPVAPPVKGRVDTRPPPNATLSAPKATPARAASPLLGAASAAAGTALAIVVVPESYVEPGALRLPSIVMAIGILAPTVASLISRGVSATIRVEHLLLFGLFYWLLLDPIQGLYSVPVSDVSFVRAIYLQIGAFAIAIWFGTMGTPWKPPAWILHGRTILESDRNVFTLLLMCFALGIFPYAWFSGFDPFLMLSSLFKDRWSTPWARASLGGWNAFIDHMVYFGLLCPALTVLISRTRNHVIWRVAMGTLCSLIVLTFIAQGGNRRILGSSLGAALITWVLTSRIGYAPIKLITAGIAAFGILMVLDAILEMRTQGAGSALYRSHLETMSTIRVDDNFLRLGQINQFVPAEHDYCRWQPVVWALIRPVPRALWPGKPIGPGFDLAATLGQNGVSLSASVLGDLYLSYGFVAIIVGGLFYGRVGAMWNTLRREGEGVGGAFLFAMAAMAMFVGMRSLIEIVLMHYMLIAWAIAGRILYAFKAER